MLRTVAFILIASGGIFMVFTAMKYNKLFKKMGSELDGMPSYSAALRNILRVMLVFFILGFAVGVFDVLFNAVTPIYYLIGLMLFLLSAFTFLIVNNLSLMAETLAKRNEQLEEAFKQTEGKNTELASEVDSRVKEIMIQDRLLHTVNSMSSILLESNVEKFDEAAFKCLGMLSESVSVDRTYVWENHWKDGKLFCTQVYEWSGGAEPQQGNDLTVDVAFPEDWYDPLSNNRCVNGIVSTFPDYERGHLQAQGIISILVVPVFLKDKFWGFVGFDDCKKERIFSESEEVILRSASLLLATAMLRNEITQNLVQAREEAMASTKAKSDFLSNMSHEIRTPINAITGMAAIARQTTDPKKVEDCLDKINAASYQLLGLINDILDMNKIEAGKMELAKQPFSLPDIIQNVKSIISIRAEEKKQNFTLNLPPDLPKAVIGDDVRLSQIFINLLSNAVKFTPENGNISLDIKVHGKEGNYYKIEAVVCDDGIGIPPDQQQKLFMPFEQADRNISRTYGGTGLGLAISKNIAELMHGDISVQSTQNKGSCFTVRVKLKAGTEDMLEAKERGAQTDSIKFTGYTALLAEDVPINREIVLELLGPTGIKIDTAENGREALEMFSKNPDKYDIIFMDIQMPEMDGYTTTERIRALNAEKAKRVPIIAMTANAYKEDVEKALASGMNGHLSKPINIASVIQVIKDFLEK